MKRIILAAALLTSVAWSGAFAQAPQTVRICNGTQPNCPQIGAGNPLPVTGSFSASIAGFTPSLSGSRGTPVTVTTSDSTGTLPTGTVVIVTNVGTTNPMYCNVLGVSATVADQLITANGGEFAFTKPVGATALHCIATGGSTTANTLGGDGLPGGATGGGGGGSGGGGAITIASGAVASGAYSAGSLAAGAGVDGWDLTQGAIADAAAAAGGTGSVSAKLRNISANTAGVAQGASISGLTTALIAGQNSAGNAQLPFIDPCQANVQIPLPFSIASATTTNILTGTAAKKIYVCYFYTQTAAANNIAVIQATTGGCVTGAAAMGPGGTTAANGMNNAANSGQAMGSGGFTVMQTTVNNNDVCVITSSTGPLAGLMRYVVQ